MKKGWLVFLVAFITLGIHSAIAESNNVSLPATGAVIQFGEYEIDNKTNNGNEPIDWIVLEIQDGKALLVSQKALDCLAFNEKQADLTWVDSSIRNWLNTTFLILHLQKKNNKQLSQHLFVTQQKKALQIISRLIWTIRTIKYFS